MAIQIINNPPIMRSQLMPACWSSSKSCCSTVVGSSQKPSLVLDGTTTVAVGAGWAALPLPVVVTGLVGARVGGAAAGAVVGVAAGSLATGVDETCGAGSAI